MLNKKKKKIRGIQLFLTLFTALVIGSAISIATISSVRADPVSGFSYSGLSADGGTEWSYNSSTQTFTGSATGKKDSCDNGVAVTSSNLTIKNVTGVSGTTLVLTYTKSGSGSFKENNNSNGSNGDKTYTLDVDGTVVINITSAATNNAKTTLTVKIKSFTVPSADKTTHFDPAPNGTYTIKKADGKTDTCSTSRVSVTQSQADDITVTASPNSGYRFVEWQKNNVSISLSSSYTFKGSDDGAVYKPVFTEASNATFLVSSTKYFNLNSAITAASSGSDKVIKVIQNGTVTNGTYTIPSGVTLLLPFDDANTLYTTTPAVVYNAYTPPTPFRTLVLESGVNLIVNGSISLSAKLASKGQMNGNNGITSGAYGCIKFSHSNSSLSKPAIDVKNGGKLYVWGYIHGDGNVLMRKGSVVYECFEIKDWRGGSATSNKIDYSFPFNQYHIENVESKLYLYNGAVEKLYSSVNASSSAHPVSLDFIGSNNSMFRFKDAALDNEDENVEYFLKYYDSTKDQLFIECHASASLSSINVGGLPLIGSISSKDYTLPLTNNISITIFSGFTVSVTGQDFMMLPGSELNIQNGGRLDILAGAKLYLIDTDEWLGKNLAGSGDYLSSSYSPTRASGVKYKVSDKDAKLKVNGLFYIYGDLYVTVGGANICCDDGVIGKLAFQDGYISNSPQTLYELSAATGGKKELPTTTAKFRNSDGTYLDYSEYLNGEGVDKDKMQMIDYGDENGVWKWGGKSSAGITSTIKYTDPLFPSFEGIEIELLSSNNYTFFTSETIAQYLEDNYSGEYPAGIFQRGNNKIQYWRIGLTEAYYKAGYTQEPIGVLAETLIPIWEGWINENNNNKYLLPTTGDISVSSFATGLYYANTYIADSNEKHIYKFTGDGILDKTFTGTYHYVNETGITSGDNQLYYIENGIVQENYGLYFDGSSSYYYFGEANYAYKSGIYYVSNTNGLEYNNNPIMPGYYYFDSNGVMDIEGQHVVPKSKPTFIHGGYAYVTYDENNPSNNVVADNYGLFALNGYLYYASADGVIINSTSFFVNSEMINNCNIGGVAVTENLYYFDSDGRMYDLQLHLITNGGQS